MMKSDLRVGSIVRVINCKNTSVSILLEDDYIGKEVEIIRLFRHSGIFILKGLIGEWTENNVELVKQISVKESTLKEIDYELERVEKKLTRWDYEKEKLLKEKERVLSSDF